MSLRMPILQTSWVSAERKFFADMMYGMLASGSCLLSEVVLALQEDTKRTNTIDRLSRHLAKGTPMAAQSAYLKSVRRMLPSARSRWRSPLDFKPSEALFTLYVLVDRRSPHDCTNSYPRLFAGNISPVFSICRFGGNIGNPEFRLHPQYTLSIRCSPNKSIRGMFCTFAFIPRDNQALFPTDPWQIRSLYMPRISGRSHPSVHM